MSGPDIFISYARGDQDTARLFAESFLREGFRVWWDDALHSGETFDEVIEKELRAARAVVVLWSPRSAASRWVRAEATVADRKNTLAPVIIEPCDRPIIFELTHTVDLSHWKGEYADPVWRAYIADLRRMTDAEEETGAPQVQMPEPPSLKQAAPTPPAPQPAAGLPDPNQLPNGNLESILSAISSLQQAIGQPGNAGTPAAAPAPQPAHQALLEESDETQFYTSSDEFALYEGNEFHCLEVREGEDVLQRFLVGPLGVKIGRSKPADVILVDSKVSRSHCLVELKDNELFVSDLNSTNGTFVDGKKVTGASVLPVGSTLRVGQFALLHEVRSRTEL